MTRRKLQRLVSEGLAEPEALKIFFLRVREKRVELGLSQTRFGEMIGLSQQMVGFLENGSFPRDPDRVKAIANALNVSLDWLFGNE